MAPDVRETFSRFPTWSQPFWTLITGKPLSNERPVFVPNGWGYLLLSLSIFLSSICGSMFLVSRGFNAWTLGLLLTFPLTVLGARLLILTIAHQCAHMMFCQAKVMNTVVHDVLTTLICSQNYDSYRYDHFHVHHGIKTFGTFEDPVLAFICQLGFTDEKTKAQLWRRLLITCVSPAFHARYLMNRLRYNLFDGRIGRRFLTVIWWGAVTAALILHPAWVLPTLIAYILPITLCYNISAFLELICEHVWMRPIGQALGRERITELSWGRFTGEAVPSGQGAVAWMGWAGRMMFYHLPCRLLVLTGDAPQHDFHHMVANNRRWTVSAYERRDAIASKRMDDREVWGLFHAIDIVFENISAVPSHRPEVAYLSEAPKARSRSRQASVANSN